MLREPTLATMRRDPRTDLPAGAAAVVFELGTAPPRQLHGQVLGVSATGLAFVLDADPGAAAGTLISSVEVRLEDGAIRGDLNVRYARAFRGGVEIGCVFYPASLADSGRWMRLVSESTLTHEQALWVRCSNCHRTVPVADPSEATHRCASCGQEYTFEGLAGRGLEDLYERSRTMAAELDIDLPSSASITLGLLSLSTVRDVLGDIAAPIQAQAQEDARDSRRTRGIDPAFQPAIDAGTLSPAQAAQRGSREAFAQNLVARHGIRIEDAYAVADNRTSLLQVISRRAAGKPIQACYRQGESSRRFAVLAAAVGLLLLGGVVIGRQFQRSDPDRAEDTADARTVRPRPTASVRVDRSMPTPAPEAEVQLDAEGRATLIRASRPEAVLRSYCRTPGRRPVALAQGLVPDATVWLGVHHDAADFAATRAITIRKDRETGRWSAGDGSSPIPVLTLTRAQLGRTHEVADATAAGTR